MRVKLQCHTLWNARQLSALRKAQGKAFAAASADIAADLKASETLPYRTGALSDATGSAAVNRDDKTTEIASRVPYAGLLYNRTDARYTRRHNQNAGARWFEPYLSGGKAGMWLTAFAARLKGMFAGKGSVK